MADWRNLIDSTVDALAAEIRDVRRDLHAHPEPSGEEHRTARLVASRLEAEGIPVRLVPSGRGLTAGPALDPAVGRAAVAFRADLDALRIHDLKEVAYRSTRDGLMHACGHDAHASMALGAALALWRCRDRLPRPVPWRAIFQPAEETGQGAREMVAAGAVAGVVAVVALHVDPDLAAGRVGHRVGPLTACCHDLSVTVRGAGGHAARPFQAVDPLAAAVQYVGAVYQGVPRSVDAREACVVTFGVIRGGASPNVIPDRVDLLGTVRTLGRDAALRVEDRLKRIARGVAEASGATVEVVVGNGVDAVVNDPAVTSACVEAASGVVGPENLFAIPLPSLGAEDFAGYLAHAPGCMLRLGVAADDRPRYPLHSPRFDIDERALALGAKILARSAYLLAMDLPTA